MRTYYPFRVPTCYSKERESLTFHIKIYHIRGIDKPLLGLKSSGADIISILTALFHNQRWPIINPL